MHLHCFEESLALAKIRKVGAEQIHSCGTILHSTNDIDASRPFAQAFEEQAP
jgi:hypothetical protein